MTTAIRAVGDVGYYTQFKENQKITKAITAELAGRKVSIQNGDEAVAFELRENDENGKLLYFSTFTTFEIPSSILMVKPNYMPYKLTEKRILL